jgi:cell division protein FtsB
MSEKKMVSRNVAIALGLVCILLTAVVAYFSITGISAQNSYNNLQNQDKQLQTWLDGNETLLNQAEASIRNLQNQTNSLNSTINSLDFTINSLDSQISYLEDQAGLIGYWDFDDGIGIFAADSSGYGNTGTIYGYGAGWTYGKVQRYALNFDGTDTYVEIPGLTLPSLISLTVAAWINSSLTQTGYIFYNGENGEFVLHNGQRPDAGDSNPTLASFSVKLGSVGWVDVYSNPITPNSWHYIVGVWTKGVSLKIYIDGVLAGENDTIPNEYLYNPGSGYIATIGRYYIAEPVSTYFQGSIEGIKIFDRALSASEISSLYSVSP